MFCVQSSIATSASKLAFYLETKLSQVTVLSTCKETWKQVMNYRGPHGPPQVLHACGLIDHKHQSLPGNREKNSIFQCFQNHYYKLKLTISNDVETNPGPKLSIYTYNAKGLAEYSKLKRLLNYIYKANKSETNVWFLQETHLDIHRK